LAPVLVYLAGAGGGMLLAIATGSITIATGGSAGALALVAAWAMRDVLRRRRGEEDESDLLGALTIAVVLLLLPIATDEASAVAGFGGGAIGVILGLGLSRLRER
jgi:hypothetical protein